MSPLVVLQQATEPEASLLFYTVLRAAAGFVGVYLLGRVLVVPAASRMIRARNPANQALIDTIERYLRLLVFVVAIAVAIAAAGFGDLLTGSAIVVAAITLAIGVAGQEVIGNLVSGLFLVTDPDFNVGDWIVWEDGEGVVEQIRFRVTRVRTPNNEVITVPNTTLATTAVTRPYSREKYRVVVRFGLSYDDDIEAAQGVIKDELTADEEILKVPSPRVDVEELADDEIRVLVQFWVRDPTRRNVVRIRSAFITRTNRRLHAEGFTVSPPAERELSGWLTLEEAE